MAWRDMNTSLYWAWFVAGMLGLVAGSYLPALIAIASMATLLVESVFSRRDG